ncbi:TPA: FtsW/RodA/SpoVE family cell cycle protein [Streptococcus equi subsp. zooepidemicus]|uniref:Putative peptidoglycan biosynthesis protein n=1 Tax=Streptococcus equi subsp. zooepidemicus (strain H70) TaxID=553483 RepID=C0MH95_STRS7|nr:FtsW/RodA/SpoVE family cell cycle protein [Streptococcus equi]MCD3466136.1 FtsW/RodA/SpoVE family cell cycle protein [Streptococcus equi subsp. zooepidemicus]CAW99647.1 putative peptidoglycan biosynthesis protein [Streptococcus equi subsp. zooepidemicus]HEL0522186.1 FtsW/RodA/SpoVE family cell cycle protein [Streptococcus equi subsp. zooepidemicus]HEL0678277.1 FtsW/RodA/SpoVE family cell cycle protein [Streptococcus equi subsp. zooepidemicus]HEL0694479.1 FtsW/RodA/SpoVE family cell cycle pr
MLPKRKLIDQRLDYAIIFPVFCLLIFGLVSVYVAASHDFPQSLATVMLQQVLWILLGALIAFTLMFFSTEILWKLTPAFYLLGVLLMVLPLIFFSPRLVAATGAKNWITIGSTTLFQPSEFMKISYILAMSRLTVWFKRKQERSRFLDDWKLLGLYLVLTLPVMVLLALQKDLGTAMVFLAILAGIILISGISWWLILPALALVFLLVSAFFFVFLLPEGKEFLLKMGLDIYQLNRISAWLTPFDFSDTIAYQQTQSMISIGSGGFFGKGFNQLELSVPVRESDMIFTVIAENFGFLGAASLLILYLILIYRMLRVTFASNNLFYTYISTGFIMMILFHIFENIGAAVGLLPLTGIPLPFISQGGSSLISNLIGVGLILSMNYQHVLAHEKQSEHELSRSSRYV